MRFERDEEEEEEEEEDKTGAVVVMSTSLTSAVAETSFAASFLSS